MIRRITYEITKEEEGLTIGAFLKKKRYVHAVLVAVKHTEEGLLLDGVWVHMDAVLRAGAKLQVTFEDSAFSDIPMVEGPLDIVYEDEDLLVVNKPPHLPVHPSLGHYEDTLANYVMAYYRDCPITYRVMNRIDRDTSGLVIIAKNALAAGILGRDVTSRQVHRSYLAICQGRIEEDGCINAPIGRVEDSVITRCVRPDGEEAITHYEPLSYHADSDVTLVRLILGTGRTHQIRVHMAYLGHPLIGDFLYNPGNTQMARQALHSASLDFIHPVTAKEMHLHAPLPADMKCFFQGI